MFLKKKNLKKIIMFDNSTILDVVNSLNSSTIKIVLIENKKGIFAGVINDGDIRRSLLKGYNINSPIKNIINRKCYISYSEKDTAKKKKILKTKKNNVNHIPIKKKKKIFGLFVIGLEKKNPKRKNNENVVIMAGGFGKRLGDLTKNSPKALLKFEDKPLIRHIIENAQNCGFKHFVISIFYLKKMIKNFFKINPTLDSNIKFIEEKTPLGTIGSLRLIKKISSNFILMNCDVITNVDLSEILNFHKKNKSILTIGIKHFKYKNPYGVIISKNNKFSSFEEKPETDFNINAGIYVLNSRVIKIIKEKNLKNIEDLINFLSKNKKKILTFPIFEEWLDLGQAKNKLRSFK